VIVSTAEPRPIYLPRLCGVRCFEQSGQGYLCTRLRSHTGRHAATTGPPRRVLDVWPAAPVLAEVCS
jgi:hypothetical protein